MREWSNSAARLLDWRTGQHAPFIIKKLSDVMNEGLAVPCRM